MSRGRGDLPNDCRIERAKPLNPVKGLFDLAQCEALSGPAIESYDLVSRPTMSHVTMAIGYPGSQG
jgi:hypothetical protein